MVKSVFSVKTPEESPGFLLWQTTMSWQRLIKKALEPYNISHPQFVILAITLWFQNKKQEITQTLIINQSKLDKMTVSKSLKGLVTEKYIKRSEHQTDMRAKTVFLTEKGRKLIEILIPVVEAIDAEFFGKVSKKDQGSLIQVLNQIVHK